MTNPHNGGITASNLTLAERERLAYASGDQAAAGVYAAALDALELENQRGYDSGYEDGVSDGYDEGCSGAHGEGGIE